LQVAAQSPLAFNQAIGVLLSSYSLQKRNTEYNLLSIHHPVQAVLQDCVNLSTYCHWAERVAQAMNNILPSEVESGTSTGVSFE
jgi:hypothetical protein